MFVREGLKKKGVPMKALELTALGFAVLMGLSCGSGQEAVTAPTAAAQPTSQFVSALGVPSPCTTATPASPLPFVVFSRGASGCTLTGTTNAVFSATPTSGPGPLPVTFSMCGSFDTNPAITLNYKVAHGDGSPDDGSDKTCKFKYTYPNPGTYPVTECVWDEIPAHAPGVCKDFTVTVAASCSVAFLSLQADRFCTVVTVMARTTGSGQCGQPLVASLSGGGVPELSQANCPPGTTCSIAFSNPPCDNTNYVVTGVNAPGSAPFAGPPGCGC
jgi:hypothetical protein